jgi:hypothetical protein
MTNYRSTALHIKLTHRIERDIEWKITEFNYICGSHGIRIKFNALKSQIEVHNIMAAAADIYESEICVVIKNHETRIDSRDDICSWSSWI